MITPTQFKARFPEHDSVDDSRIQIFINKATLELDEGVWGDYYDEGLYYLTAHFLQLDIDRQNAGSGSSATAPVASKSIGDVSVSFAVSNSESGNTTESYFQSTSYGQEYWRMLKIVGVGMVAIY